MVLEQFFAFPFGLWVAVALIPFLILYLIRPKPQERIIPSLMFLLRDKDQRRNNAFFRTLMRELFFLLQLIAFILLIVAAAAPFLEVPQQDLLTDTVIVLDDSASMHTRESSQVRWQQAQSIAQDALGAENTIILAGRIPRVVVEGADKEEAEAFLAAWRPSEQPTYLGGAILAAQDHTGPDSRVVIISDMADTDPDTQYEDAIQTLRAKGVTVTIEQVGEPGRPSQNIGIVDVTASDTRTTVLVQNFYANARTVNVCAANSCSDLPLGPGSSDTFSFPTPPGITEVTLDVDDDLSIDDAVTISASPKSNIRILVVTNEDFEETSLYYALRAIERTTAITLEIQINRPPALVDVDHDLIIFSGVDQGLYVQRTFVSALERARTGGGVIIMHQQDMFGFPYGELLPLTYQEPGGSTAVLNTENSRRFTGIDYGSSPTYHVVEPQKSMQVLARAEDETPLISTYAVGAGRVLYYGLPENTASFSGDPLYPVFWKELLNQLTGRQRVEDLNVKTGTVISATQVRGPDDRIQQGRILLDRQGLYETPGGVVSAALADARESNTALPAPDDTGLARTGLQEQSLGEKDLTNWALLAALFLLFSELAYVKWRGDA